MIATVRILVIFLAFAAISLPLDAQTSARAKSQSKPTQESQLVFEGRGSRLTDEFEIEGPWLMSWRLASDYPRNVGFHLVLVESPSGISQGNALETQQPGSGYRLFDNSGRFRFRVSSTFARWHLTIRPLSEDEAARWQPKQTGFGEDKQRDLRSGILRPRSG